MKKNRVGLLALSAMVLSMPATAVDCGPYKVVSVQPQMGEILVQVEESSGKYWKNLGAHTDVWIKAYQSVAQQALASGNDVHFRFPDGHVCAGTDYSSAAEMIRILH